MIHILLGHIAYYKIAITKFGARWVDDKKNCKIVFDKVKLDLAINYILDNSYFIVWNSTFKEVIVIAMGSDSTPLMANHFPLLIWKQMDQIYGKKILDLHRACSFANTFTDDLCTNSNTSLFENYFKQLYPEKLVLKKQIIFSPKALFPDINLDLKDNKMSTKLFD